VIDGAAIPPVPPPAAEVIDDRLPHHAAPAHGNSCGPELPIQNGIVMLATGGKADIEERQAQQACS
jgi:hypothetical protein